MRLDLSGRSPHNLVKSFKSTLDKTKEWDDIIIHVVDVSHEQFHDQIAGVRQILANLSIVNVPTLIIFNKMDDDIFGEIQACYYKGI